MNKLLIKKEDSFSTISNRKISLMDLNDIYTIFSDKGVEKHSGRLPLKNKREAFEYFLYNFRTTLSIRLDNKVIGFIEKKLLSHNSEELEIYFIIKKEYRNKHYARKALEILLRDCSENTQISTILTNIKIKNLAAIKVIEAIGFTKNAEVYNIIYNEATQKYEESIKYSYEIIRT